MKKKFGKLLFIPVLGILAFNLSCTSTSDPTVPVAVYGCMDPQSINYNPRATIDDKSCLYAKNDEQAANAVIEIYSGVRSKRGAEAQLMANNILASSPDVVVINLHTGPDAIAKIGWPDYTSKFGKSIADTAGMSQTQVSYPGGSVNRYHYVGVTSVTTTMKMLQGEAFTVLYKDGFLPAANYWMSKVSPINIGLATYWTSSTRKLKVLVELYYKSTETVPNYLNIALLENGLVGKQLTVTDTLTDYVHNHVLRWLLTDQWGELITTTTSGTRFKKTYEYTVPTGFTIENCDIAVFVSQEVNGRKVNILTGKKAKVKI